MVRPDGVVRYWISDLPSSPNPNVRSSRVDPLAPTRSRLPEGVDTDPGVLWARSAICRGAGARNDVDARTGMFSFGVVLYG